MNTPATGADERSHKILFWGCFLALVATAFGFIVRAMVIDDWGAQFKLSETEKGEIFGAGLWPFAISIVLFSLVVDKIGYGTSMIFAFVCHVVSAIVTITADGYTGLYVGTIIVALGNGVVEAVINPVVATMFPREKTKWLSILHAGWPGGLVLGGLLALSMGDARWTMKVGLIFIPTALYGLLLLGRKFPVNERVAAGVSYRDMLKEAGALGALIVSGLIVLQLQAVFQFSWTVSLVLIGLTTIGYGLYVGSLGQPVFVFLLFLMIPLATTELGTDSWITELMTPEMAQVGIDAGWVLVYTSFIMMVLRFCAGPIVHRLSPLGMLATSSAIACVGLIALSYSTGLAVLLAATLYAVGKTFFWPTMLGVVAERFPKGGALTLNMTGGVGMLGVGVLGAVALGWHQDRVVDQDLAAYDKAHDTALHDTYIVAKKPSIYGEYIALDADLLQVDEAKDSAEVKERKQTDGAIIKEIQADSKKQTLRISCVLPLFMLFSYLALIAYFKKRGEGGSSSSHA
ncbi:MAG: MFS transporter [Planctomycetes bacterium]|nr:MFS transporter [Planctomycetota bacterium]